jgi:hypothetical protein
MKTIHVINKYFVEWNREKEIRYYVLKVFLKNIEPELNPCGKWKDKVNHMKKAKEIIDSLCMEETTK